MTKTEMRIKLLKRYVDSMKNNASDEDIKIIRMLVEDIATAEYCDRSEEKTDG